MDEQVIKEENEERLCLQFLDTIAEDAKLINKNVKIVLEKIDGGQLKFKNGHKLIGLKNQMLLSYMIDLTHLVLGKVEGKSIVGSSDTWRMIETRTVLERMRGMEQKLKYEIEKKLNSAVSVLSKDNPLSYKPDPSNLVSQVDDGEEDNEGDDDDDDDGGWKKSSRSDVYRPPKLVPKFYDGDEPKMEKKEKLLDSARKKALKSSLMSELKKEFTDQPEEINDGLGINRTRDREKQLERTEYEETYFTRAQLTKNEKVSMRKMRSFSSGILDFGRFSDVAVLAGHDDDVLNHSNKKRKSKQTKKGSKKRRVNYH